MEKAEVLDALFTSLFTGKTCLQEFQGPEVRGKVWSLKDLPLVGKDQVRENEANMSMGPDDTYLQVLTKLANVIVRPLSVNFEKS